MEISDYIISLTIGFFGNFLLQLFLRKTLKIPYEIKKIEKKNKLTAKYNAYIINYSCLFHAISMILYGFYTSLTIKYDIESSMTDIDRKFLTFSIAYYFWDIIYESWAGLSTPSLLTHHFIMIIVNTYSMFTDQHGCILRQIYFIGEFTNPMLCLHQNIGFYKDFKDLSEKIGLVFCVCFLFMRVVVCTYMHFSWSLEPRICFVFKFVFSFMFFIGFLWSFQTVNKLFKMIRNYKKREGVKQDGDFYAVSSSLRHNKKFIYAYQIFFGLISFGPMIVTKQNNWF